MAIETNRARTQALHDIDKFAKYFKLAIVGGCAIEVVLLSSLLWLMDFHNPTHLMLVIGFVGSYSIVVMALVALGVHVSRVAQGIVKALEVASGK